MTPTSRKSAPVEMPWFTICRMAPCIAARRHAEEAEHHVAEVGDRRVGDEAFDVLLLPRDERAVEDAAEDRDAGEVGRE